MPIIHSLEELDQFARAYLDSLTFADGNLGDGVALIGDLGAGKTTFVRAILRALNYHDPVLSPTYPILQQYEISWRDFRSGETKPGVLIHIDAFRLDPHHPLPFDPSEWQALPHLLFVEWPDRLRLPPGTLKRYIHFEIEGAARSLKLGELDTSSSSVIV